MKKSNPNYHVYVTLEEETQRIAETVKDLVAYAHLRDPNKVVVDVNDILRDVICSFKDTWQEKGVQVIESLDKDLPMIMADKDQITLVCKNIIGNSIRAINGKGVLKISTEKGRDNNVNVAFHDSGRGIPSDVIGRIFDPFFVVNEEERGMGLGLCVSNKIIKSHGGDLTARSQKERGTIFQFTLPVETF